MGSVICATGARCRAVPSQEPLLSEPSLLSHAGLSKIEIRIYDIDQHECVGK